MKAEGSIAVTSERGAYSGFGFRHNGKLSGHTKWSIENIAPTGFQCHACLVKLLSIQSNGQACNKWLTHQPFD